MIAGNSVQEISRPRAPRFKAGVREAGVRDDSSVTSRRLAESSLESIGLADLPAAVDAIVAGVERPTRAEEAELVLRLVELGFVPGETVRIVAEGFPGREPLAIRLGSTVFALRRFEASLVRVHPVGMPQAG